ncbi:MAG: MFS transporter [Acidimicrobiales bacterium]|nr:MFS transporter [Acidimicrobiales bacterium]
MKRSPLPQSVRRLVTAVAVSSVGDGMALVAFPLLAVVYTHRPVLVAGVVVAERLPALLLVLPAGALVDRVNRRRLMMVTELSRFSILAGTTALVVAGSGSIWLVYAAAMILGAFSPLHQSASAAVLPEMVDGRLLARANGRLGSVEVAGQQVVGQALGGFAFSLGKAIPFAGDSLSFLLSALLLRRAVKPNCPEPRRESLWAGVRDGLRIYGRQRTLRLMTSLIGVLAMCQGAVMGIFVLFARVDLRLTDSQFGLVLAVSAVGNVVGALAAERIYERFGGGWSLAGAGLGAAVSYPILAFTTSAVSAAAALTLEALAVMVGVVSSTTMRQSIVPAGLQGRARSVHLLVTLASAPLGALAGGLLAGAIGLRTTFVTAGILQFAVVVLIGPRLILAVRSRRVIDLTAAALAVTDATPRTPSFSG